VLNVNDAPVATGSSSLASIAEDTSNPSGDTVSNLFDLRFSDAKDSYPNYDPTYPTRSTLAGVAIVGYSPASATKGDWQYSADGTDGSWVTLTARSSDATSFAIPSTYKLRFLPVANFNGSAPTLTVRLIESSETAVTVGELDVSSNGGTTRVSADTVALSHSVTAVNDAPVASGAASLASINEDTTNPPGATVSDLFLARFNDSADQVTGGSNANNFAGIAITSYTSLSSKGIWQYNNGSGWNTLASVTGASAATIIPAGSSLRFLPAANFNGPAPTITAVLIDDSSGSVSYATSVNLGTTGGTTQYSSGTVVLSHTVTAVNDAPVASGSASLPAILEDSLSASGTSVVALFNIAFSDATDSVFGGSSANTLAGVAIRSYVATSVGAWEYSTDGGANWSTLNAINPANDGAAFALKASDRLRFNPAHNYYTSLDNGSVPVLVARLIDSSYGNLATGLLNVSNHGGTTPYSVGLVTLTTSVTSVNDAPSASSQSVSTNEDTTYTFNKNDFGSSNFSDSDDNPANLFAKVKITGLPATGTLLLNGATVSLNDFISIRDIQDGKLTFVPAANSSGQLKLLFKAQDDGGTSNGGIDLSDSTYTVTINIAPVNDPPTSAGFPVTTNEDEPYTFSAAEFPFADPADSPANSFKSVKITSLPLLGTLELSGVAVTVNQVILQSDLQNLKFIPVSNKYGSPYATFGFKVTDDGGTQNDGVDTSISSYTVTINVNPVNDQPFATGNATLPSASKNSPNLDGVTVASLFGSLYSDPNDQPNPNSLTGIAITELTNTSAGSWQYYDSNSSTWVTIQTRNSSNALQLKSTDLIRFVPATDYVGPAPTITVRLIENINPTTGSTVDLSGSLPASSNYSSNTSTLNHEIKGGLVVKGIPDVSEGSRAVFTVSLDAPTTADITLGLSNETTESDDYVADFNTTSTWDASKVNVYYLNGSTAVVLPVSSGVVSIVGLSKFYVSVPTNNDAVYEGPESLRLSASMTGSSSSDISTILDNGRGKEYNQNGTPKASNEYTSDNDLSVDVTAITPVNEGSDYAFFKVVGASGDRLRLAVANGTASLVTPRIDYAVADANGNTSNGDWTQYDGASNIPLVPGALGSGTGTVYVRVSIVSEQDDNYEGGETFTLTATSVENTVKTDVDTSTIVDDGTGKKYGPNISGGNPQESTTNLDDDRALMVTSYAPVNEGSTYHMFKVTAPSGVALNLALEAPPAGMQAATISGFTFEYSTNKTDWTPYDWNGTSGNRPVVPTGGVLGEVYVRVNITSEMDNPSTTPIADWYEGSDKFQLKASTDANKNAAAIGEILDDGLGGLYTGAWGATAPTTSNGQLDDDRVWAVLDSLYSPVLSTVTVQARSNDGKEEGVTISDQIDLDPSTPNVVDSQYVVANEGTWKVVNGNVTYSMLSTFRRDPTPINYAIRPTDRTNFSKSTAPIIIDFPVGTVPDGNIPATPGSAVTIPVLTNDTYGDTPKASTLRFASTGNRNNLVVSGQGTWSINADNTITFTPLSTFTGDPTPVSYLVNDDEGNASGATLVTVTYQRDSRFVVQINDGYNIDATGFDVIIVDNIQFSPGQAPTINLGNNVTVTPTVSDTDMTVGRIYWTGATANFTRVTVDAKSKPILTGSTADLSIATTVSSTKQAFIEIRASDMGYQLAPNSYTLASPIGGTNYGSVLFSETVGLTNQAFTNVADPTSGSNKVFNATLTALTARSLSWNASTPFTISGTQPASVSLAKSIRVAHGTSSRTTQLSAGGKFVESSQASDLGPYINWVNATPYTGATYQGFKSLVLDRDSSESEQSPLQWRSLVNPIPMETLGNRANASLASSTPETNGAPLDRAGINHYTDSEVEGERPKDQLAQGDFHSDLFDRS